MFSVCVLLFGDHHKLATRCLESIKRTADWRHVQDVRIGMNAVSKETRAVAQATASSLPVQCHLYEEDTGKNVWKYPLMRRMFNQRMWPLAPRVMWFDDDSYIKAGTEWWGEVSSLAKNCTLLGSLYSIRGFRAKQIEAITKQSWYAGKPVQAHPRFATGGWWCLDTKVIEKWNYPFPVLKHNGGDSILGELCNQQDYKITHFNHGVAINADEHGRESKAVRRGDTTKWPWEDGCVEDYSHHDFSVTVRTFLNPQLVKDYVPPLKIIRTYE